MGTTNDFNRFTLVDNLTQDWLFNVGDAVSYGDLMYDNGSDVARPADKMSTLGTEALDQAQFALKFIGVSQEQVLSTETNAIKRITLGVDRVCDITCPSQTWNKGDLVGIYSNGTNLDPQQVDKVTTPALAIGMVMKYYGSAVTRVRVRLIATRVDRAVDSQVYMGVGGWQGASSTTIADGNATLTVASNPIQKMTPTVARTVTLPAVGQSKGMTFWINNLATGAFPITVANAGATTIGILNALQTGVFFCDGVTWYGLVGDTAGSSDLGAVLLTSIVGDAVTLPITGLAGTNGASGTVGGSISPVGGAGGTATTGTAGAGGAGTFGGAAGGAATGAAGIGGAGGNQVVSAGAGGAASNAASGNAGNGGTFVGSGGAGGAATGTGAAGGGTGGTWTGNGGAGGAAAGTSAAGVGGNWTGNAGAGGSKSGTGAAAGGAGGTWAAAGGAGGNTASSGSDAGGAGGNATLTAGTGANATAGTGNGGAGGNINFVPGAGGTSSGGSAGVAGEIQFNGAGLDIQYFQSGAASATNETIFVATRAYRIKAVSEVHDVAAGGASTFQIFKDTGTTAMNGGTNILSADINLNATARTVQNAALAAAAATLLLAAGDRLSIKFVNAIQSTVGLAVTIELAPK